jgi:glutamine amidotransferase
MSGSVKGKKITVVDYGLGNLFSVCRAIEAVGGEGFVSANPQVIASADRLLLPGVGAFGSGMEGLQTADLLEAVRRFGETRRPFLGICLGMQMMLDGSEENPGVTGLGLIPGVVRKIPSLDVEGRPLRIPQIGWNRLRLSEVNSSLLAETAEEYVYFVHSFHAVPAESKSILACVEYGGHQITAAIARDHWMGVQFHPEKSGRAGLSILKRFIAI